MIRIIKQEIRNYLTDKYDDLYFRELEEQVCSYDEWIREREVASHEKEPEIIWDLEKEKEKRSADQAKAGVLSYSALECLDELPGIMEISLEKEEIVILAEDAAKVSEETIRQLSEIFSRKSRVELIYGDEDEVNSNGKVRMNPWFKPDYSPDTLLSWFYFGNLVAVRKERMKKAIKALCKKKNRIHSDVDKDTVSDCEKDRLQKSIAAKKILYALILEVCSTLKREQIFHLKKILYSSHCITYWGFEETYQDIRDYYDSLRIREQAKGVSIVIPSKDNPEVLARCLKSIVHWTKDVSYEIIVVDNGSKEENRKELECLQKEYGFSCYYEPMEFNFSRMCNMGAGHAKYELLLFLNDDCEVRSSKWLAHMADLAAVKTTGAVGAKLYYPESKRIQHCGIYNIHLGPVHKLQFKKDIRPYYDRRNLDVRNVLAVTAACLMVRKSVFDENNGFDENLKVAFNDVDFCYRLYKAGYDNIIDNEVHLWHHESLSRGSDESPEKLKRLMQEKQKLYQKHSALWEEDPYYHPGFTTDILDTGYSFDYEYPHHKHLAVENPVSISKFPAGIRADECVAPMIEYAGDLRGWFLDEALVKKIEDTMGTDQAAYLQGNAVVLGSDNACFEKKLLLRHEATGAWYQISPEWYYRPDVESNLQNQKNVALSGFACLINMSSLQPGRYEVGILAADKISKQQLLRVTTRSIEKTERK